MNQKRVVHILNELNYSGAEKMLMLAAPYLKEKGIELIILTTGVNIGDYSDILRQAGYQIYHIPWGGNPLLVFYKVYKFLIKEKPDVVHIHREHSFFWLILTAKIAGIKSIIRTIHNVFIFSGFLRFKRMIQRKISGGLMGARFLSIGESVHEVERKYYFNNTIIIPNWIDQKKFQPILNDKEKSSVRILFNVPQDSFVIISIGACTAIKNHEDIILSVNLVKKKFERIFYMHLGQGELNQHEQELVKKLSLEDNVKFYGQIENVRDALIASDLIIMPSQYEGLPISLLEAMSCGIPAVVYNVYGIKDLIKNDENGSVVDSNPESLARGILNLVNNVTLRKKLGEVAIQKVAEEYDMKKSIDKMVSIY